MFKNLQEKVNIIMNIYGLGLLNLSQMEYYLDLDPKLILVPGPES